MSLDLRFHHALPGWCKVIGLKIREIPECEGGGYMIPEAEARRLIEPDIRARAKAVDDWFIKQREGKHFGPSFYMLALCGEVGEAANLLKKHLRGDFELNSLHLKDLGLELADVQLYLWHLERELGISLESAITEKLDIVEKRWGTKP